jgi:hypothetical protein
LPAILPVEIVQRDRRAAHRRRVGRTRRAQHQVAEAVADAQEGEGQQQDGEEHLPDERVDDMAERLEHLTNMRAGRSGNGLFLRAAHLKG